jgi:tmRNA-binding protein
MKFTKIVLFILSVSCVTMATFKFDGGSIKFYETQQEIGKCKVKCFPNTNSVFNNSDLTFTYNFYEESGTILISLNFKNEEHRSCTFYAVDIEPLLTLIDYNFNNMNFYLVENKEEVDKEVFKKLITNLIQGYKHETLPSGFIQFSEGKLYLLNNEIIRFEQKKISANSITAKRETSMFKYFIEENSFAIIAIFGEENKSTTIPMTPIVRQTNADLLENLIMVVRNEFILDGQANAKDVNFYVKRIMAILKVRTLRKHKK